MKTSITKYIIKLIKSTWKTKYIFKLLKNIPYQTSLMIKNISKCNNKRFSSKKMLGYQIIKLHFNNFCLGSLARKDEQVGSWFVYAIALVFAKYARWQHLRGLFLKVKKTLKKFSAFF